MLQKVADELSERLRIRLPTVTRNVMLYHEPLRCGRILKETWHANINDGTLSRRPFLYRINHDY